ncbi:MAG: transposase [Candidatus Omnitrophica bacterium]|nr:transposase [Candidatus Omnitrophota bacterium]
MPRPLRLQDAGYIHHVICRGNDRKTIFKSQNDFKTYLGLINEARRLYPIYLYNYVLMDKHTHLLLEPKQDGSLSKFMEYISKGYAKYFNKKYDHVGHVFQGRFKSFIVQKEKYFFACTRYIDMNPVRARLVNDPSEYNWSCYNVLSKGKRAEIQIDRHDIYKELGRNNTERQIAYRALIISSQGDELDLLNKRAGILGDADFKSRIKRKTKR